ncbi:DMT family transporter [Neisseria sp. ZJ106]|uniref:DMT family transporter n=1 Tax=Neisseria lisongii TaxID=2912188 RepID=A0ABY7RJR5_9NEIS|nr:DMT family transporter [Neisseria lisongii]MCF7521270.1 DMT family transporter [Neisseria lisongii]WCL71761.1 DMT family transporter [Neisseria lisongii]
MFALYLLIALSAGLALPIQAAVNSRLAAAAGGETLVATFVSFAVGTLFLFFAAWAKTDLFGHLATVGQQPWWKLSGGLLGSLFVFTTILLAPKLGVANMLFVIIIGQLTAAAIIDHFGLIGMAAREISFSKLLGLGIMGIGLAVFSFGDKILK